MSLGVCPKVLFEAQILNQSLEFRACCPTHRLLDPRGVE